MKAKIRKFIEEVFESYISKYPDWCYHWNKDKNHPIHYFYKVRFECNLTINPYMIEITSNEVYINLSYSDYEHNVHVAKQYNYFEESFIDIKEKMLHDIIMLVRVYNEDYSNEWWMNPAKEEKNGQTD